MKILLIAGHGNGDPGAVGNGYREADLTREVVNLLSSKLSGVCDVEVADTSKNWFEYLKTNKYDFKLYDYVLEIHFNSGGGTGVEIFVTTSEKNTDVESAILSGVSDTAGYKSRGVKRINFSVISKVKAQGVSSALLEVCFIDRASDVATYQNKKEDIAHAIADGIAKGFGLGTVPSTHWAEQYRRKLEDAGYVTDDIWKNYDCDVPVSYALALLDKMSGGMWPSDEADTSIHWAQPNIISLCGKGIISDKTEYINLVTCSANLPNALCLALTDKATGGMIKTYVGRETDHWGRNHLDSLCDKGIVTTPDSWTNFEGAVTYGNFMALMCKAFKI